MPIEKIKKRDGRIQEFDRNRIEDAILKACAATGVSIGAETIGAITNGIVLTLEERFADKVPGVEDVQDMVERKLAEQGLFEVAKAYILYRKDHERLREEKKREVLERIEKHQMTVKKRDGRTAPFDLEEVRRAVIVSAKECDATIDIDGIVSGSREGMYDGIATEDINKAVIMAIRGRIEEDPAYSSLAARFLFNDLYKNVLSADESAENFEEAYRSGFKKSIEAGVACGRLDKKMLEFDFPRFALAIQPSRDRLFKYLGAQTLYDRYFLRDYNQNILETPQYFWMRIAMGLSLEEKNKEAGAIDFYEVMSQLLYVPSTPTLFHSGTSHPQMSSCYLTTVNDDLSHIFKCIGDNAQLSKWSGGIGNDWTNIRGTGAQIKSTNVGSQGVIPFLKIVDAGTAAINRSGKRRGATCVYLETWHYDIEDFLELRKNTGDDRRRTHDTNTANWIPDLFMKRVIEDGKWTLFSPEEVSDLHDLYGKKFEERYEEYEAKAKNGEIRLFREMRAKDLWRKMITMLYETGHPWITFKDACNIRSPQDHTGVVHSSNLCTEITLNTSAEETAVCNLGSVNLASHVAEGELNKTFLARTVKTAMRMLDNVIDLNFYPTPEAKNSNLKHRPVGLGIMGMQDMFYMTGVNFDTENAVELSDEVMEFVSYYAILASSELAQEKGAYSSYKGSKWDRGFFPIDTLKILEEERGVPTGMDFSSRLDWEPIREKVKKWGMRNSNCLAIAPTATNANINGCLPSVEPAYKNVYVKSNFSGEFTVINEFLVDDLKKIGLWREDIKERLKYYDGSIQLIAEIPENLREKYKEVFEIDPGWVIRHAARRGKWIDQSQSINIFTTSKSGVFLSNIYIDAWKSGMKTTYYLRTLGASSVEKSTLDINKKYSAFVPLSEKTADAAILSTASVSAPVALSIAPAFAPVATAAKVEIIGDVCEGCE